MTSVAVEQNHEELMVRVETLNGHIVLQKAMRMDSQVEDLKRRLLEVLLVPFTAGLLEYQIQLVAAARSSPLLDSEFLADVYADSSHPHSDEPLPLTISIIEAGNARGPFALGQDRWWGQWENMSNSSGPFSALQGSWQMAVSRADIRMREDSLHFHADTCHDEFGNRIDTIVKNGVIVLRWGYRSRRWRLQLRGDFLFALLSDGQSFVYRRVDDSQ
jgi:hypothetical protein